MYCQLSTHYICTMPKCTYYTCVSQLCRHMYVRTYTCTIDYTAQNVTHVHTYSGSLEHGCIIDTINGGGSASQELVLFDLVGEQQLVEQVLRSTSQDLVEDVVASLAWLLEDDTRLLQEICRDGTHSETGLGMGLVL